MKIAAYIAIALWFARRIWGKMHRPHRNPYEFEIKTRKFRRGELDAGTGLYAACIELNAGTMYNVIGPVKLPKENRVLVEKLLNAHYVGGLRKRKDFYRIVLVEDPAFRDDIRPASEYVNLLDKDSLPGVMEDLGAIIRCMLEYQKKGK